ncbi:hypothetical protein [Anatilimnocola aggregata]|nr:hypothetical protein [Anatilimnocola aggregata]
MLRVLRIQSIAMYEKGGSTINVTSVFAEQLHVRCQHAIRNKVINYGLK